MLHYAQGLAASPPVFYKLMVGRRAAPPLLFLVAPEPSCAQACGSAPGSDLDSARIAFRIGIFHVPSGLPGYAFAEVMRHNFERHVDPR